MLHMHCSACSLSCNYDAVYLVISVKYIVSFVEVQLGFFVVLGNVSDVAEAELAVELQLLVLQVRGDLQAALPHVTFHSLPQSAA